MLWDDANRMLKRITKRDIKFDKRIRKLPDNWLNYNPFLLLENRGHGIAEFWKFILYRQQRDAARTLFFAHSNQHSFVGHQVKRNSGEIVLSSQVLMKAYYLRYCVLLIQACGDKLAQLVRHALDIKKWRIQRRKGIEGIKASEDNTTLTTLAKHLRLNEDDPKPFYSAINSYLKNDSVKVIVFQLANEIKHKWVTAYQGEGLSPQKNPIFQENNGSGKISKEVISIGMTRGIDIDLHINHALIANNAFVETAGLISALLEQELLTKKTT